MGHSIKQGDAAVSPRVVTLTSELPSIVIPLPYSETELLFSVRERLGSPIRTGADLGP
jgi:hypothetical protein